MSSKAPAVKEKYLLSRLKSLGLTKKDITVNFKIPKNHVGYSKELKKEVQNFTFFTGDDKDNIQIHYFRPKRMGRYHFEVKGNKYPKQYIRTRLNNPAEGMPKYLSDKGSGLAPFFPPALIDAYINQTEIKELIITEGEFKAFVGCQHGLNVLGIPSIHGFYSNDTKQALHEDIADFIEICQVKTVFLLTDAHTLVIKYDKEKDLTKRQNTFYNAVKLFREAIDLTLENPASQLKEVVYSFIKPRYNEVAKGLDDLLIAQKDQTEEIKADLLKKKFAKTYFQGFIITDGKLAQLSRHFGLDNPTNFYAIYKDYIGLKPFRYYSRIYEFDGEKVKYLKHEDTDQYCRIGSDWFKQITLEDKNGQPLKQLIPWKIGEILRDYKKYKDFIDNVPKYDGFCSYPDFTSNYKRVKNGLVNIYLPIEHTPAPGPIDNTLAFLKHIFGGKATAENQILGDTFTIALDYLTLQFNKPTQMLPVPILVSKEYGTGKSTFLKWLSSVYVGNTAILNNDLFKMSFNSHYIQKYIIAIDEGFLDVDKKAEKERLKQLVTADTMYLQNKGVDVKPFTYYGKLILCSNDADNVMKMENGEDRWFVIKVPVPKEKDPDLEAKLIAEIPAWLHFLSQREVYHPKQERFWFHGNYIKTEQYHAIVRGTKTRNEKIVEDFIAERFLYFGVEQFKLNDALLLDLINKNIRYRIDTHDLKKVLEEKREMKKELRHRYVIPDFIDSEQNKIVYANRNDRPYIFNVKEWLNADQFAEFQKTVEKDEKEVDEPELVNANSNDDDLPF